MSDFVSFKERLLASCLELAGKGFLPGTGGNLALRINAELFAVTPSASDYYAMTPDDICILEFGSLRKVEGTRKPSVESGLHALFLSARRDFRASVHTHQPIASAVTLLNIPIPITDPVFKDRLGPIIPMVPYYPSGTSMLARALKRVVRSDASAYLLRNHGLVCGGRDLPDAISKVALVEQCAGQFLSERFAKTAHEGLLARARDQLSMLKGNR